MKKHINPHPLLLLPFITIIGLFALCLILITTIKMIFFSKKRPAP